jgi:hypothetical protein
MSVFDTMYNNGMNSTKENNNIGGGGGAKRLLCEIASRVP